MNAAVLWQFPGDPPIPDDVKWGCIRGYRNQQLSSCDWTQLPDAPLTLEEKQVWAAYRQELRDIPNNFTIPDEIVFPDPPGGVA